VITGIAGGHINSFNSSGVVAVKGTEVDDEDVERVLEAAKAVAVPMDREIIHVVPQDYIIDDQEGIKEPLGMCGVRLECKVHIVTAAVSSAQNIIKCCNKAGLQVSDVVLQPIASAESVLTPDEKELGCLLIDIGGGTSDYAIFSQGSLVHTGVVPVGGDHITSDIAVGFRTPQKEAEKIKINHGCALSSMISDAEMIEVPSLGGRKPRMVSRFLLSEIIEPRVEEMFTLLKRELIESGFEDAVAGGIVITGGTTQMTGMTEMAEFVFDMPVKLGSPREISGAAASVRNPRFSTGVGLVQYGGEHFSDKRSLHPYRTEGEFFSNMTDRFRGFFGKFMN
jgi:cell division protein FtsA